MAIRLTTTTTATTVLMLTTTIVILAVLSNVTEGRNEELRLVADLIYSRRIDRYSRPVVHHSHAVAVEVDLRVLHLVALNDRSETLNVNGFLHLRWKDGNLTWNPANYSDVKSFNIPDFLVWKPDVTLVNSAHLKDDSNTRLWSFVTVGSDGTMDWWPPVSLTAPCSIDVDGGRRHFPFDEYDCPLTFASLSYANAQLTVSPLRNNQTSSQQWKKLKNPTGWHFESCRTTSGTQVLSRHVTNPFVEYTLRFRRKAPYYQLVLLLPVAVAMIALLSVFWLPPTSGEKITLSCLFTLVLAVLLVHMHWVVPVNGGAAGAPGVVVLCSLAVAFAAVSVVLSVVTLALSRSNHSSPAPAALRKFLRGSVGRFCCVGLLDQNFDHQQQTLLDSSSGRVVLASASGDTSSVNEWKPESEQLAFNHDWRLFASLLDRLFFVVYVFSFGVVATAAFS